MDIRQIERLMRSMEQHGVTKLELTEKESALTLVREGGAPAPVFLEAATALAMPAAESVRAAEEPKALAADAREIASPMVGTFHPRAKEPVKVGAKLRKGDVVCVIEAMKLMNDVVMEEDGEITYVALKDGDMVEYGQIIAHYKAG